MVITMAMGTDTIHMATTGTERDLLMRPLPLAPMLILLLLLTQVLIPTTMDTMDTTHMPMDILMDGDTGARSKSNPKVFKIKFKQNQNSSTGHFSVIKYFPCHVSFFILRQIKFQNTKRMF